MQVKIIDIDENGNGIGKIEGKTVFVKNAIYGETCTVEVTKEKRNFLEATKLETVEESPYECHPFCKCFFECGGCTVQDISYEKQMELKVRKVENHMKRIGKCEKKIDRILGNPSTKNYRNKIELKMQDEKIGYYAKYSHQVIEIDQCPIAATSINDFLPFLKKAIVQERWKGWDQKSNTGFIKNITIRANHQNELQLTLTVSRKQDVSSFFEKMETYPHLVEAYLSVNTNRRHERMQNCSLQFRKKNYLDCIGNAAFRISPRSFFQINRYQTENLYREAARQMKQYNQKNLLDLYVGIGTTSIFLADSFVHITGVEILEEAIKDANFNKEYNQVQNVDFILGKSEEKIGELIRQNYDTVLVDPPRKGLDEKLIHILGESTVQVICYISCNSATMARDIKLLQAYGFVVIQLSVCDMFSHTMHVECVVLMSRKQSDRHKTVEIKGF